MNAPVKQQDAAQMNLMARGLVLDRAIDMWQSIYTSSLNGDPRNSVINVPVRNVGLIKRFVIEITGTIVQSAAETLTRTPLGLANALSNITFTDLSNQTRINTSGWHMHMLASARRQMAFGAAFNNDAPMAFGNNFNTISAAASVTNTPETFRMFYEIPLSYGDSDLRGAIYANVVNATMNLQFTINPNFVTASGANPTLGVYSSSAAQTGVISNVQINVYQNYLDQLPVAQNGPVLPLLDLSTAYLINNTVATGVSQGQDFAIPYANFRNFMSTFALYDNFGSASAVGADINYWSIQSANYTNIIKVDPYMNSLLTREIINDDFPAASGRSIYYFDHRRKPINTVQYGNMQLIANPAQVQSSASQFLVGYEALALINMITQAGSLYNT